jgi:hypothetical protein
MQAMKEIRELAKRIKTLQEQNAEDENAIKAKEAVAKKLDLELDALAGVPTAAIRGGGGHAASSPPVAAATSAPRTAGTHSGEEKAVSEVALAVTSATDDAPAKKSSRSRYDRRSSPHYNASKNKDKDNKDHEAGAGGETGGGGGGGGSGIKEKEESTAASSSSSSSSKDKKEKEKEVREESSNKIATFLKPGKKRDRSVRQKRVSERADHIKSGGTSD